MEDSIGYLLGNSITIKMVYIFILLLVSAFFSGSETSFFSLSKLQLKKLENNNNKTSKRILKLLENPRELLITILLGNTLVNVSASSIAALIALDIAEKYFTNGNSALIIIFEIFLMTIVLLIFGEITPKLLAYKQAEKISGFSSLILTPLSFVLLPIVKVLDFISRFFSKKDVTKNSDHHQFTAIDLQNLINSNSEHDLEETEKKMISSIFKFSTTVAKEIMAPRVDIKAIDKNDGIEKLKQLIIESGHSRIPVYEESIDKIAGFVYAKDILLYGEKKSMNSLIREPFYVTTNMKIQDLLNQFKAKKIHIAIVVDEYGGTSGLITLEDILEELVGEIMDEYDEEQPMITKISNQVFNLNGMYTIADLNSEFSLQIDDEEYDTLASYLLDAFNKVPSKNDSINYEGKATFTVTKISEQRILNVRMKLHEQSESNG